MTRREEEIAQAVKQLFLAVLPFSLLAQKDHTHPAMNMYKYPDGLEIVVFTVRPLPRSLIMHETSLEDWRHLRLALLTFWEILSYVPSTSPVYSRARLMQEALSEHIPALTEAKSWHAFKRVANDIFTNEKIRQLFLRQALQEV